MNKEKIKLILFWVFTILGPTSFLMGGYLNITLAEQAITGLKHLGYPVYFGHILGFWKLVGAVVITIPGLPRLKEWAYAGFVFNPFFNGSNAQIASPLIFLVFVILSYVLRPDSRKI